LAAFLVPEVATASPCNSQIVTVIGPANVVLGLLHESLTVHGYLLANSFVKASIGQIVESLKPLKAFKSLKS
jgi:hypothetical protein